jgi:hypothetical protein
VSQRLVEPELLDELRPEETEAQASRRDLRRINLLMGHVGAFRKVWLEAGAEQWCSRIIDLGGGDGTLLLRLVRSLPEKPRFVLIVDRQPVVSAETVGAFKRLGCHLEVVAADVFEWLEGSPPVPGTLLMTNLFLHHFQEESLRKLLQLVSSQCQVFVACEPRRTGLSLLASRMLGVIGCNAVTRHDAVVSVRAGFRDAELSALWPESPTWRTQERGTGLFSHLFWAGRNESEPCRSQGK